MATAVDSPRKRRLRRPRWIKEPFNREARAGYLFILPWVIGFLVFTLGAMVYSLVISFTNYDLSTDTATPVGFSNYELLLKDPKVLTSLGNTLYYAVLSVPLEICFALLLAYLLHRIPERGAGVFRIIYYLPKMTPSVAAASIFLLLLNGNSGAINGFLGIFGIDGPQWLIDPDWMKPSIIIIGLWSVSGTMLILLAALKNVPQDLYEAAALDGAGALRQFFSVTLPMISNALFFCTIVLTIAALQVFDQAFLLFYRDTASGSPDAALFVGVYLFQQAFQQFNMGFAAAIAWLLFVIILLITVFQVRFGNKFVYYEGGR
ncbi:sugar ABC transporter permease [Arthrobacter tumbae]|uniref:carbohydrate ABC transporter permease n=1 Tax=Arthrobacter tumbae TaxID=163874 RepID=UPI001959F4C8|nr:sugar ABC transporter permease [Arthrobacter tumbae]MBM7782133.1 multiple sugar transport system permease protein [Arthrobacter tumbae]